MLWEVLVNIVWLKQCVSNYYCGLQSTTLTLHYSGRQLRMNFISTVAQWDKFFVFLLCIRFFLLGSCLIFGELWQQLFQGSFFQNFSSSDQCFSCHKLFKLEYYGQRISQEFYKLILLWITLHLKRVCFDCPVNTANWALKFTAIRNLLLTMIGLTRNFLIIEIVSVTPHQRQVYFLIYFYFIGSLNHVVLRHSFSTVGY